MKKGKIAKLREEIKRKWVEALRSGEYPQQKDGFLRNESGYCCLGVLCDLHSREFPSKWSWKLRSKKDKYYNYLEPQPTGYRGECSLLPEAVSLWAGFDTDDPFLSSISISESDRIAIPSEMLVDKRVHLSELNDKGLTFEQIANFIEKYL